MRFALTATVLFGLSAVCATTAEDAPQGPTIVPVMRAAEGRLAFRRSLLRRSEEGLAVLKDDVTEEQIELAMASRHHEPERNITGSIDEESGEQYGQMDDEDDEADVPIPMKRRGMGRSKHGKKRRQLMQLSPEFAPTYNNYDCLYFTNIQLGTPGKTFSVVIDTGSSDLWIPGLGCSNCGARRRYNSSASSTARNLNMKVTTYYGLGSATGSIFTDTARFGNLVTSGQVFIVTTQNTNVQPSYVDGLIGLSFSSMSWANSIVPYAYVGRSSLIENLYRSKKIAQPAFGVWLDRYVSWSAEPDTVVGGELAIGGTVGNPARYSGNITWLSVPSYSTWWNVQYTGISGPDGINILPKFRNIRALIDTGTALIVTDYAVAAKLNTFLGAYATGIHGLWAINCQKIAQSNITFTISLQGFQFTLTGADLPSRVWSDDANTCYAPFQSSSKYDVLNNWLLGDVFLRKYYQIYDYNYSGGRPRVGLALANH